MSIFEETSGAQPVVAHDRSLELFFDRFEVIARFAALINEDPVPRRLLYLHGLGGNGKSLLLRYLAAAAVTYLHKLAARIASGELTSGTRLRAELVTAGGGCFWGRGCAAIPRGDSARTRTGRGTPPISGLGATRADAGSRLG
jgi:hypothetical protein